MTKDNYTYCLIMVTVGAEEEGATIAKTLLAEKLAACVNITPINSFYAWQGKINQDREWQLLIKTRFNLFEQLAQRIKTLHSYDVPEIIALPIMAGDSSYLNWIAENTKS
ncbi:MAG: divalent-cation tolerance protein CutA [Cyanobacteria bacterium P01_G01_bin.39]